jgi:hypothetical protein
MSRSVSYATGSQVVTYADFDFGEDDQFDDLVEDFRTQLQAMFPSVRHQDAWLGREDHVLAGNARALFGMSEYGGLVSYWIVPRSDPGTADFGLATRWIESIAPKFVGAFGRLRKVATMSNGEGVYERLIAEGNER